MKNHPLIRTVYLYLFALLGLVLLTIGCVRFIDLGLRTFVFTAADQEQRLMYTQPSLAPVPVEKIQALSDAESVELSAVEKQALQQWLVDYNSWQENNAKIDYLASSRQRNASLNLALIIVGLPLYLFHWLIIRRESKESA